MHINSAHHCDGDFENHSNSAKDISITAIETAIVFAIQIGFLMLMYGIRNTKKTQITHNNARMRADVFFKPFCPCQREPESLDNQGFRAFFIISFHLHFSIMFAFLFRCFLRSMLVAARKNRPVEVGFQF